MKKFLLMFSTVLMLTVCFCVPAFAFEDTDSSCPVAPDGEHNCGSQPIAIYSDGRYYSVCHYCENAADLWYEDADFSSPDIVYGVLNSIVVSGVVWIDDVRYDRCDCDLSPEGYKIMTSSGSHYFVCGECGEPFPAFVSSFILSRIDLLTCTGSPCLVCSRYSCPAISHFHENWEDSDSEIIGCLSLVEDSTGHYLLCSDCGAGEMICSSSLAEEYGEPFPPAQECFECSGFMLCGIEYGGKLPDDFFGSAPASILPDVTSGVTSAASWVSTFANTIVTTPILLLSAILAFIGFGIGIFKRLRT